MTPDERKAALKRGDQAAIARELGRSPAYVCEVVRGTRENTEIQKAIARRIRRPLREVFPRQRREAAVHAA